jgi:hypothetical protein
MTNFQQQLLAALVREPGLTDRQLTDRLLGRATHASRGNQEMRLLVYRGRIVRKRRRDVQRIGNYLLGSKPNLYVVGGKNAKYIG